LSFSRAYVADDRPDPGRGTPNSRDPGGPGELTLVRPKHDPAEAAESVRGPDHDE
jgi:hypothetical protein